MRERGPSGGEFVAMIALTISLVALSIDAMLPALSQIAADLGAAHPNDRQFVLTALFAGLTVGQLFFGPLSDSVGRKPAIFAGTALFVVGGAISALAVSFPMMIAGRLVQGVGAAGPRSVAVAMVRDLYEGRAMARIMSFVSAVFIIVPIVAPSLGQAVLLVANWRAIFVALVAMALAAAAWIAIRQPETLPPAARAPFSMEAIGRAMRACVTHRVTLSYTIAAGLVSSAFVAYLATAQQIFQEVYGLGPLFPLAFGALALAIGIASLVNARLVMRLGTRPLALWAARVAAGLSVVALAVVAVAPGHRLPLAVFFVYMQLTFFCVGVLFGNLNAMAMAPMGHIAGVAAAVIGALSSLVSIALGTPIGWAYDGTILPLVAGFAVLDTAALVVIARAEPDGPGERAGSAGRAAGG